MYRYLYPIHLEADTLVKIDNEDYATMEDMWLIWTDYKHIEEELGINEEDFKKMSSNLGLRCCMPYVIGDPNSRILTLECDSKYDDEFSYDEYFYEPDEDSKPRSHIIPIKRGMERYMRYCLGNKRAPNNEADMIEFMKYEYPKDNICVRAMGDIIEVVDYNANIPELLPQIDYPLRYTSLFEEIYSEKIPKGICYKAIDGIWRRASRDIPIFDIEDNEGLIGLIMKYHKISNVSCSDGPTIYECEGDIVHNPTEEEEREVYDFVGMCPDEERSYRFLNMTVIVKPGYTKIIPLHTKIMPIMKINTYKDITIV